MDKPLPTLTDQGAVELPAPEETRTELRALEEDFPPARVDVIEARGAATNDDDNANANNRRGYDPLYNSGWQQFSKANTHEVPTPGGPPTGAEPTGDVSTKGPARGARPWPLKMTGPLGAIVFKDCLMFNDKLMLNDEYRYNGVKGGIAWKSRLER